MKHSKHYCFGCGGYSPCEIADCVIPTQLCATCKATGAPVVAIKQREDPAAHVEDPEWEGGEEWRHPLDPLAHKRRKKPSPMRVDDFQWHRMDRLY